MTGQPGAGPYSDLMAAYIPLMQDLDGRQQALLSAFQDERQSTVDEMVYHYTGDIGLYHILGSGKLWVSDYTSMNDPSEINYGVNVGREVLKAEIYRRGNPQIALAFLHPFEEIAKGGLHPFMSAYVLSMSLDDDELTQWRLYADGGRGFAMGFASRILDRAYAPLSTGLVGGTLGGSFRVLYDEARLRAQMQSYVDNALNVILTMPRVDRQAVGRMFGKIGTNLMFAFIYTALYFKHPAYRTEREYRYLVVTVPGAVPPGLLKRPRRSKLIDYLEMDWKAQHAASLKSIRVGPAADWSRAQTFVMESLGLHLPGSAPIVLDQSKVPFRT